MQKPIHDLMKLGRMPDESDEKATDKLINKYDSLLSEISGPVSCDEAEKLVTLFPETSLFGLEWTLLHVFESVYGSVSNEEYERLISLCPGMEWKATLKKRYENKIHKTE